MNFTEAAEEVLRLVGKPLHYKRITEIAIERNLLSHVGKTPDITMSARLATMVKKDRSDAPIYKIKPGVFALRDFSQDVIDTAMKDDSNLEAEVDERRTWRDSQFANGKTETAKGADGEQSLKPKSDDDEGPIERVTGTQSMPGADVFPEEADDDELIFSDMGERPAEARDDGRTTAGGSAGRSRRRRGGRRNRERRDFRQQAPRNDQPIQESRVDEKSEAIEQRGDQSSEGEVRQPESANRERPRVGGGREPFAGGLSDAVVRVLSGRGRRPMSYQAIAQDLVARGRLRGSASALAPTLAAAVRGENARRQAEERQPRFRERNEGVGLTHWDVPGEVARAEKDAEHAARRQREQARNAFLRRLRALPDAGLLELLATWLNAEGVNGISGIVAEVGDYALRGLLRRGAAEYPIGVVVFRGGTPIDRNQVNRLRSAREHFGNAQELWIVALGQAKAEARDEAMSVGSVPCVIYDGIALARAVEKVGVGLRRFYIPLSTLDAALLDSLGGGASESTVESFDEDQPNRADDMSRRRRRGGHRSRSRFREERESADQVQEPREQGSDQEVEITHDADDRVESEFEDIPTETNSDSDADDSTTIF